MAYRDFYSHALHQYVAEELTHDRLIDILVGTIREYKDESETWKRLYLQLRRAETKRPKRTTPAIQARYCDLCGMVFYPERDQRVGKYCCDAHRWKAYRKRHPEYLERRKAQRRAKKLATAQGADSLDS
jgi:hypothetical protein